jgi:hypothetical protein
MCGVDILRETREGLVQLKCRNLALVGFLLMSNKWEENLEKIKGVPGITDAPFRVDSNGGGIDISFA